MSKPNKVLLPMIYYAFSQTKRRQDTQQIVVKAHE